MNSLINLPIFFIPVNNLKSINNAFIQCYYFKNISIFKFKHYLIIIKENNICINLTTAKVRNSYKKERVNLLFRFYSGNNNGVTISLYLQKLLRRLVVNEGNNSGAGGLHELHVGGGDVRHAGGVAEASGGAVPGMADDSDDRLVIEVGIRSAATGRRVTAELTREDD